MEIAGRSARPPAVTPCGCPREGRRTTAACRKSPQDTAAEALMRRPASRGYARRHDDLTIGRRRGRTLDLRAAPARAAGERRSGGARSELFAPGETQPVPLA